MIANFAYHVVLGMPLVAYGGIITLAFFIFTAIVGYSNFHGKPILPFKWHPVLAVTSLTLAALHGFLALSIYLHY